MSVTRIKVAVMAQGLGDNLTGLPAKITITAVSGSWPAIVVREENVIFSKAGKILTATGEDDLIIELKPTDGAACYKWVFDASTGREFTRYTSVPVSTEIVNFGELPIVNPKTYRPTEEAVAAWEAALANFVDIQTNIGDTAVEVESNAEKVRTDLRAVQGALTEADEYADDAFKFAGISKGHADRAATSEQNAADSAFHSESFLTSIKDYAESSYMSADNAGKSAGAAYLDRVFVGESRTLIERIHGEVSDAKVSVDRTKTDVDGIKSDIDLSVSTVQAVKTDILESQRIIGLLEDDIDADARQISLDKGVIVQAKADTLEAQRLTGLDRTAVDQIKTEVSGMKTDVTTARKDTIDAYDATAILKADVTKLKSDTDTLTGQARTSATEAKSARDETVVSVGTMPDWGNLTATLLQTATKSAYLRRRLTGNPTIGFAAGVAGQVYSCTLELLQDGTGGRSIILANVATPKGAPIVLSSRSGAIDIIRLEWNGSRWAAFFGGDDLQIPAAWVV